MRESNTKPDSRQLHLSTGKTFISDQGVCNCIPGNPKGLLRDPHQRIPESARTIKLYNIQ